MSRSLRTLAALLPAFAWACAPADTPPATLDELAASALSTIDGDLALPGLLAPVEVIRDTWGVPHIYADNDHDLFFAQGFVMAQDRLWQMEMWRRWHEGRLAEIFGPEAFPYDARTRLMMYRGPFDETEWTSYHPDAHALFAAYADGVNAFLEQNADDLPVEFQLTGVVPDPWTAETVVLRWAQIGLSSVRGHAISELQLAMNVARYGADEANRRAAPDPFEPLVVADGFDPSLITQEVLDAARAGDGDPFEPGRLPELEIVEPYRALTTGVRTASLISPPVTTEGSNNWVMSGSRTPSGVPILANDPHRRIEMPALRYLVHLNAPGWNLAGGSEPPFVGINAGNNETMAWGFTFAGTDMVDVFVEEMHPTDDTLVRWQDGWEPLRVITEQIRVKGEAEPRTVQLKYSRHGPVFYEDLVNRRAYAVQSAVQHPGTAAYLGSFQLMQAPSCDDFFERAMHWLVPTHNLICGDRDGNIALQVTGLTPDRGGWNGRLPVPGDGRYEWKGFRDDLPREFNPERGYIATANNNTHPEGYTGRPVFYHSTRGVPTSRITRLHQILGEGEKLSVEDHERIQYDAYSLQAERDIPAFQGWSSQDADVEWARSRVAEWDGVLTRETVAGAIYVTWADVVDVRARDTATPMAERKRLAEAAMGETLAQLARELGQDRSQWRYGRIHASDLPHMLAAEFDLPTVERPGGFETVNATGANFRRIIDLADIDNSVWTNAPGQSAQPGSPFYGNLRENLANGEYFPLLFSRGAVESGAAHRLTLNP